MALLNSVVIFFKPAQPLVTRKPLIEESSPSKI